MASNGQVPPSNIFTYSSDKLTKEERQSERLQVAQAPQKWVSITSNPSKNNEPSNLRTARKEYCNGLPYVTAVWHRSGSLDTYNTWIYPVNGKARTPNTQEIIQLNDPDKKNEIYRLASEYLNSL